MSQSEIGLIGLGVMGANLALNMESKGIRVVAYDRDPAYVERFAGGPGKGRDVATADSLQALVDGLGQPRCILVMIKAGTPVDWAIGQLSPLLQEGDIVIDGGNSHFADTIRRTRELEERGLLFIGAGISGGEEGALKGPAIMPGGSPGAWPRVKPILQAISAKVDDDNPCCDWIGPDGAGHFVKMTHNGIEYCDMQLICEAYNLMATGLGMRAGEMHEVFRRWNEGVLDSYLIEITRDILGTTDPDTGKPMVDVILDTAGQKGTGKWTSQAGLDMGAPIPQIAEAVFARCMSAVKEERVAASGELVGPSGRFDGDREAFIRELHDAVYASKICSYAQGFQLLRAASREYGWGLDYGRIALLWRGGCIIRARFLGKIKEAYGRKPDLPNLLLDPYFKDVVTKAQAPWRNIVKTAVDLGIPTPAMSSALFYYDSYRSARLPANLLQAQRDYFGAHTYERVDRPRGEFFHTNWTGKGGTTTASTYTA
jgi:6-phosphogluconate dehydrogenase